MYELPEVRNPEFNVASLGLQTLAAGSLTSICCGVERSLRDTGACGGPASLVQLSHREQA